MSVQRALTSHPSITYPAITLPLAFFALSATPPTIPLVLLLTTVLLHFTSIVNRSSAAAQIPLLILNLAVGSTLANFSASTSALSKGIAASLGISLARGASSAVVALIPIAIRSTVLRQTSSSSSPWLRTATFPLIWSFTWLVISRESPVGRLGTWTPLDEGYYGWTRPFVGFAGIDFVVAAWAEVAAAAVGQWIQGEDEPVDLISNGNGHHLDEEATDNSIAHSPRRRMPSITLPTLILLALSVPSFFQNQLPLASHSPDSTPLAVSCILPPPLPLNSPKTQLQRYLAETKATASRARILLWPEGAVSFENHKVREDAMKEVITAANTSGVWIGASFDEPDPTYFGKDTKRRNGLVLAGPDGLMFEYFKRNLVPVTESFSFTPSVNTTLPLSTISLKHPSNEPKPNWPTYPRPLLTTASICLDFSKPLPHLPGHPNLILAPAKTWHPSIGSTMARLAHARAEELGATILWCDGGSGSVSGVYGAGRGVSVDAGLVQVGTGGTWLATIGLPYTPEGERQQRTVYGFSGDWGAALLLLALVGSGWAVEEMALRLTTGGHASEEDDGESWATRVARGIPMGTWRRAMNFVRGGRREEAPLLVGGRAQQGTTYGTLVDVTSNS